MDNIKVAIRVRPLIAKEQQAGLTSSWIVKDNVIAPLDKNKKAGTAYTFDRVYDEHMTTYSIFEDICKPIIDSGVAGFHGTIFAYGQSSSGKTFTMSGNRLNPGIMSLSVEEIFGILNETKDREFLLRVSYLELYNEKLTDLLAKPSEEQQLYIKDNDGNIEVRGLKEEIVNTPADVYDVLKMGDAKKTMAETKQNDRSSRSHCILRMVIESRKAGEDDSAVNVSHLNFVDLAGSEKAGENTGDRLREGCHINLSLFYLSQCISKLSDGVGNQHVNYRDSKLTRILQNALGGNSKTAIICAITPASVEESHSTLRFASTAKTITNKPKVNECLSDAALLKRYESELQRLQKLVDEKGIAVSLAEKEDLQKKLIEKETAQRQQEELIEKLKKMIITSGNQPVKKAQNTKMRRLTWCPGNTLNFGRNPLSVGTPPEMKFKKTTLPMIEDISPPRDLLDDTETLSFRITTRPKLDETRKSFFDNKSIFVSPEPHTKKFLELQNKHEFLQEDFEKLQKEMIEDQLYREQECVILQDAVQELTMESEALKKSNSEMLAEMKTLKEERNMMSDEVYKLQHKLQIQSTKLADFQNELTNIRDEKTDKVDNSSKTSDPDREEYEQQIKCLKEQNEKLSTEISDLKNINEELSHRQSLSEDMYSQKLKEMQEKSDLYDSTVSDFMEEIQKSESDKEELKKEISRMQREMDSLKLEMTNMVSVEQVSAELETKTTEIRRDFEEKLSHIEELERQSQEAESASRQTISDFELEIKDLNSKHEDELDAHRQECEKLLSQISSLEEKMSEVNEEKSAISKELEQIKDKKASVGESEDLNLKQEEQLKANRQECEKLLNQISSLEEKLFEVSEEKSAISKELELIKEQKTSDLESEDLDSKQKEQLMAYQQESEKLLSQILSLEEKLSEVIKEKSAISQELEHIKEQEMKVGHKVDKKELQKVQEECEEKVQKVIQEMNQVKADYEKRINTLISEKEEESESKQKLDCQELKTAKQDCVEKVKRVEQDMEELKEDYEKRINTIISKHDEQKEYLQNEIITLKSRIEILLNAEQEGMIDATDVLDVKLHMEAVVNSNKEKHESEVKSMKEGYEQTIENLNMELSQLKLDMTELKGQNSYLVDPESLYSEFQSIAETLKLEKQEELQALKEEYDLQKHCMQLDITRLQEQLENDHQDHDDDPVDDVKMEELKAEYEKYVEDMKQDFENERQVLISKISELESKSKSNKTENLDEFEKNESSDSDTMIKDSKMAETIKKLKQEYEQKIEVLTSECNRLKSEMERLDNSEKNSNKNGKDLEMSTANSQLLESVQTECEELKEKLSKLEKSDEHGQLEIVQMECDALKEKIAKLESENAALKNIQKLDENEKLKPDMIEKVNNLKQEYEEKLEFLTNECRRLQSEVESLEKLERNGENEKELSGSNSQDQELGMALEENEELKQKISKLKDENEELKKITEMDVSMPEDYEELKQKISKLENENEELKKITEMDVSMPEDYEELKQKISKLENENEELKKITEMDVNMPGEYEELKQKVTKLENENEELKKITEMDVNMPGEYEELKLKVTKLENENEELKKIRELDEESDLHETEKLRSKCETLREEIEKLQMKKNKLTEEIESSESTDNFKEKVDEINQQNEALLEQIKQLEITNQNLRDKLTNLDQQRLESQPDSLEGKLKELENEMQVLKSENSKLVDEKADAEESLENMIMECEMLKEQVEKMEKEEKKDGRNSVNNGNVKALEDEKARLKEYCTSLEMEIETLKLEGRKVLETELSYEDLESMKNENERLKSELQETKHELALKMNTFTDEEKISEDMSEIENLTKLNSELKEQIEEEKDFSRRLIEECQERREEIDSLHTVIREMKQDSETTDDSENNMVKVTQEQYENVKLMIKTLQDENAELKSQGSQVQPSDSEGVSLEMYESMQDKFEEEIQKWKEENSELQSRVSDLENELEENKNQLNGLHSDETMNLQVQHSVGDTETKYNVLLEDKMEEIKKLNLEIDNLREKQTVQEGNSKEAEEMYNSSVQKLQEENSELLKKISDLETKLIDSKNQLNELHSDETVNLQVQRSVGDVKTKYDDLLDDKNEEIKKLNLEIENLKENQTVLENDSKEKMEMYSEVIEELKVELKDSEKQNDILQHKVMTLQNNLAEQQNVISQLHGDETVNLQVQHKVGGVKTEYESMLSSNLQEIEKLNSEIDELRENQALQEKAAKTAVEKTEMYEETIKDFEVEMKKLKDDNFTLQNTIEKLQCELRENRITMSHLHSDETVNLQVHSSVNDVRTEYEAKLEEKLQEIEKLSAEIKNLNEKLVTQNTKEQETKEVDKEDWKYKFQLERQLKKAAEKQMKDEVARLKEIIQLKDNFIEEEQAKDRESELGKRLEETEKKLQETDKEADELNNKLEKEKEKLEKSEKKLNDILKQNLKFKQMYADAANKSKEHEKQMKTLETEVADKNLEIYNLKRSVSKAETQQEKRTKQYEETIHYYEKINRDLKNEIRRLQSVDDSFAAPPPPPSSASKDRGYAGTSSAGGAIDHFAVIMLEGEKKRLLEEVKQLKKENAEIKKRDKNSSSVCNCKHSVSEMKVSELKAKLQELEKENIDLKKNVHDLRRDRSKAKHELPFHDLNDISNSTQSSSDEPSSMWTVPQFKIPDLEKTKKPKVPDAEQCKQQ